MSLAINSPEGQKTRGQEERAYEIYWRNNPLVGIVQTDKEKPAKIDAFLIEDEVVKSAVLTSCRKFTVEHLCDVFNKEALLTYDKLMLGAQIADLLCCSLTLFLYAVYDDVVLVKKLYEDTVWLASIRKVDDLETDATCEGGRVTRLNGMIDISGAKIFRPQRRQT